MISRGLFQPQRFCGSMCMYSHGFYFRQVQRWYCKDCQLGTLLCNHSLAVPRGSVAQIQYKIASIARICMKWTAEVAMLSYVVFFSLVSTVLTYLLCVSGIRQVPFGILCPLGARCMTASSMIPTMTRVCQRVFFTRLL